MVHLGKKMVYGYGSQVPVHVLPYFSHLYVIINDSSIEFKRIKIRQINVNDSVITDVDSIPTEVLLERSKNTSSLLYVAAVVNASQYIPGYRMIYILGAGDNTTDPYGNVFHNRELKEGFEYFFRVFSIDSTPEVCMYFNCNLQGHYVLSVGRNFNYN